MRRARIAALAAAVALSAAGGTAGANPSQSGVLVEGQSLGGVHIGWSRAQVIATLGHGFGRCRSCSGETLYFNEQPFRPQGVGVELRNGRVVAVFTLWAPAGWRTAHGLRINEPAVRATATYGALPMRECSGYREIELPGKGVRTMVAIVDDVVWGFALLAPGEPVCR